MNLPASAGSYSVSLFWFQTFVFRRKEALAVLLANRETPPDRS
jgi:hypothetical protein